MTTITRHVTVTLTVEIDGSDVEIDLSTSPTPHNEDSVFVGLTIDGKTTVTWLTHDDDVRDESPFDNDGITWDSFRRGDPDRFNGDFKTENKGRAFLVECYDHGQCIYALRGSRQANNFPDRQWDVGVAGILTLDGDFTNPEEAAVAILAEYTSWCNGDSWGITTAEISTDGSQTKPESCWGFLGSDYAISQAKSLADIKEPE